MIRTTLALIFGFTFGVVVGRVTSPSTGLAVVKAQSPNPFTMSRLYTGSDNQTHVEEKQLEFTGNVFKMLPVTGAELHRASAGSVADWHTAPRRQYVISLRGQGEIEVAGGKKIAVGPGHIDLVEDVTGKGHITKVTGTEERLTLWLPLADQTTH